MYDVGVAVHHDGHGKDEHDDELVPREQDPLRIATHIAVRTRLFYHVRLVVVVHTDCRVLGTKHRDHLNQTYHRQIRLKPTSSRGPVNKILELKPTRVAIEFKSDTGHGCFET